MSWFRNGVDSISNAFGGRYSKGNNPFQGGSQNPFTQTYGSTSGNPFATGMPGVSSGFGAGRYNRSIGADYGNPMIQFEMKSDERMAKLYADFQRQQQQGSSGGSGNVGQAVASNWLAGGALDSASGMINSAANKFGVPANLLKSVIARESTGNWERDGNRYHYMDSRGYNILPYVGITDPAARSWGYDPKQLVGNQAMQIEAAANGLSRLYQAHGAEYGWEGVVNTWYSGDPTGGFTPGDSFQHGTTNQYTQDVMGWWQRLDAESGSPGSYGGPSGGAGGSWTSAWGGGDYPITQGHGPSEFSLGAGAWMYDYAKDVGVNGHPGLDVGMGAGTRLFAPAGGTVVIAGGSGYYRDVTGDGPGRGELRIQLDNGDIVILGHMRSISLVPGQRIEAGAFVGTSGSFNGDHLHYEVRKSTPGATSSGYTAVDPREYFSGAGMPTQQNNMNWNAGQTPSGGGLWWQRSPESIFSG